MRLCMCVLRAESHVQVRMRLCCLHYHASIVNFCTSSSAEMHKLQQSSLLFERRELCACAAVHMHAMLHSAHQRLMRHSLSVRQRPYFRRRYESVIVTLCECLDTLDEPEARAAMVWVIGEYAERIDNADELLEGFLEVRGQVGEPG